MKFEYMKFPKNIFLGFRSTIRQPMKKQPTDPYILSISMLWQRQAIFKSKGDKLSSAECRIRTKVPRTESPADGMPADKPTELSRIKQKLVLNSPSLWSASIQPTRPHCRLTFTTCSGDIRVSCCQFRCFGTGKRFSNWKETGCLPLLNAGFEPESLEPNLQQTELTCPHWWKNQSNAFSRNSLYK